MKQLSEQVLSYAKDNPFAFRAPMEITKVYTVKDFPNAEEFENLNKFVGIFEAVVSTSNLDRDMDKVAWYAIDKGAKQLNEYGIVMFNHNYYDHPIGTFIKAWSEPFPTADGGVIKAFIGISKTAEMTWTLIDEGILKEMSIGGILLDAEEFFTEDGDFTHRLVKDWDLFEASVVTIAANPEARISHVMGKMLQSKGGKNMDKDKDSSQSETAPDLTELLEQVQAQVKESLETLEVQVLEQVDAKIEEASASTSESIDELRTEATEDINTLADKIDPLLDLVLSERDIPLDDEDEEEGSNDDPPGDGGDEEE